MDDKKDDKTIPQDLQPTTVFASTTPAQTEEPMTPEELSPDVVTPATEEVAKAGEAPPPTTPPSIYEENRNQYFAIAGVAVFFVIILIIFFKVFLGTKGPAQEIKLVYWGLWEDSQVMTPLIDAYQQKNPNVKIEYDKMDPQDYREKLLARTKNGQGPDIFRFHNTWLPEITDIVSPLPQSIMTNSEFEKTFYKVAQKDLKIGNYYYGLPLEIDGLVLIYNNSLFKKAGIPTAPNTWDDVINDVSKLTVKDQNGQIITSGIAIGTADNVDHFSDIFGLMLVQNGGDLKKLDQPEAAGALQSYRKFAEAPKNIWDSTLPASTVAFTQEKVAMIIGPSWDIVNIKAINPDLDLKTAPVPTVPGGAPVSIANYWVEGVSKQSKNQIEAWKFLNFLVQKDNLTKLYELESKSRTFGEPYSRVDLANLLIQDQYVGPVIKEASYFVSLPLISKTYDNGLNDNIVQYLGNAINSAAQGVDYGQALKTAKQGVTQVFSQFNIQ